MTLRFAPLLVLAALPVVAPSTAASSTGGLAAYEGPQIEIVRCMASASASCLGPRTAPQGARIQVVGRDLDGVGTVVFRGGRGRRDDVKVDARHVRRTHVDAIVPRRARSGRVELRARGGERAVSRAKVRVVATDDASDASAAAPAGDQVFPVRGPHDLGQSATNNFGGGRGHKGQDLFAACGTPLVVAEGGTVKFAATQARAGNYAVVTGALTGRDYVYMHMRAPALVRKGENVSAGQPLGKVGDTGNASGCHLHFEVWSAPGWYEGGSALDPLPDLRAWDGRDSAHSH